MYSYDRRAGNIMVNYYDASSKLAQRVSKLLRLIPERARKWDQADLRGLRGLLQRNLGPKVNAPLQGLIDGLVEAYQYAKKLFKGIAWSKITPKPTQGYIDLQKVVDKRKREVEGLLSATPSIERLQQINHGIHSIFLASRDATRPSRAERNRLRGR